MCSGPQLVSSERNDLMACIWVLSLSLLLPAAVNWKLIWWANLKSALYHNAFLLFPFPKASCNCADWRISGQGFDILDYTLHSLSTFPPRTAAACCSFPSVRWILDAHKLVWKIRICSKLSFCRRITWLSLTWLDLKLWSLPCFVICTRSFCSLKASSERKGIQGSSVWKQMKMFV